MEALTIAEREARAWSEYSAWARHSTPSEYAATEALAWRRLQDELLAVRTPAGTFSAELVAFVPDAALDGLGVTFEPDFLGPSLDHPDA